MRRRVSDSARALTISNVELDMISNRDRSQIASEMGLYNVPLAAEWRNGEKGTTEYQREITLPALFAGLCQSERGQEAEEGGYRTSTVRYSYEVQEYSTDRPALRSTSVRGQRDRPPTLSPDSPLIRPRTSKIGVSSY